jgi:hypothetical protein
MRSFRRALEMQLTDVIITINDCFTSLQNRPQVSLGQKRLLKSTLSSDGKGAESESEYVQKRTYNIVNRDGCK